MLFRNILAISLASTMLIACKTPPKPDTTPEIMTSVASANVTNFGFKGFFANSGTETVYTNGEMERQDQNFKFTGDVLSKLGKKQSRSNITRLDKNLVWQMDNRKKNYTECEVKGCGALASFRENIFAGQESEETASEDQCNITLSKLDLSVKKTGQQRVINNFPTDEFVLNWILEYQDDQARKTAHVITSTVWTTPGDGGATEAIQMQKKFADAKAALLAREAGELGGISGAIPADAMAIFVRFLMEELPDDVRQKITNLAGKQTPITGMPISTKVEWNAKAEACGVAEKEAAAQQEDTLNTSSFKGLLASVTKQVVKQKVKKVEEAKKKEIQMAPIFGYVREITSIDMQNVRLSAMQVPANYKLTNRK